MQKVDWSKWNSKDDNFKKYSNIKSRLIYGQPQRDQSRVSIVIITYKRADGLKNALDSAIAQDYSKPYAITVVDDSGFDQATDSLMKEYCKEHKNIVYYRHDRNLGQYANWNRACELSPTEWFCLLHDDDALAPNYLSETSKIIHDKRAKNIGLLGVYFKTIDLRQNSPKSALLSSAMDILTTAFIKLRNRKLIKITLEDNMNLIYVLSCCLMINRDKVLEAGGLDDQYFPSSDFVLSSKINHYFSTAFLPEYLCFRGISENESLKKETCEGSIRCAYLHTIAMLNSTKPTMSHKRKKRKASFAAIAAEIGVLGYNNIDYSDVKKELGMNSIYNNKLVRLLIGIKSRLLWSMLLLRKNMFKD